MISFIHRNYNKGVISKLTNPVVFNPSTPKIWRVNGSTPHVLQLRGIVKLLEMKASHTRSVRSLKRKKWLDMTGSWVLSANTLQMQQEMGLETLIYLERTYPRSLRIPIYETRFRKEQIIFIIVYFASTAVRLKVAWNSIWSKFTLMTDHSAALSVNTVARWKVN